MTISLARYHAHIAVQPAGTVVVVKITVTPSGDHGLASAVVNGCAVQVLPLRDAGVTTEGAVRAVAHTAAHLLGGALDTILAEDGSGLR